MRLYIIATIYATISLSSAANPIIQRPPATPQSLLTATELQETGAKNLTNRKGLDLADPRRPHVLATYEEPFLDERPIKLRYTTALANSIPAWNFYPCVLKGLSEAAAAQSKGFWTQPWRCGVLEDVDIFVAPEVGEMVTNSVLEGALRALVGTILKYEVGNVLFDVVSDGRRDVKLAQGHLAVWPRGGSVDETTF